MSFLKLRSKLFFLSYTAAKERWQLGWSQGGHKTEVGFLDSEAVQEEIEITCFLAWSDQINIILKADWNTSLNKLKLVILESVCSRHICYCGNNKKWLKVRHLAEKNPRIISIEKWERERETRNTITGSYVSTSRKVMASSPAVNSVFSMY